MIIASVSQSVSYFTVPPRAHPSAVSPSGFAAPGQTQVPSGTRVLHSSHSHWNTAVIEDLPRCPTTLYTIPITLCHIPHANQVKPNRTRRVYDACAARYPGAGHWGTHCLISEFLLIIPAVPAPRFPHDISISHMANILDRTRAVSYTVTHNCTQ